MTVLYESIKQKSPKIDNVAIRYPTFTCDVAFFIYNLITRFKEDNEYKGILHFSAKVFLKGKRRSFRNPIQSIK